MTDDKVRENKLRRMADRRGLKLSKSRVRDPRALGYGLYKLTDARTGFLAHDDDGGLCPFAVTLDDVEEMLQGTPPDNH